MREIFSPDALAPDDITDELRSQSQFTIVVEANGREGKRRTAATGTDIYGISAPLVVEAALRLGASKRVGALAPGEAFDAEDFLSSVAWGGLTIEMPRVHARAA